jgi:hypothetical protein
MTDAEKRAEGLSPYCSCRSGEYREAEYDARGIFLTYVCDRCRREKLRRFRADVLVNPRYWADEAIEED